MDTQQGDRYNFRKIVMGLVFLFFATFIFISQFRMYDPAAQGKQVIGIFFCVAFFMIGAMLVFSSITFSNKMIYLIAPFVVVLGTFFVMNYVQLTGIAKIVNDYPQLRNAKAKMQGIIMKQDSELLELQAKVKELEVRCSILKARSDFQAGKPLDAVIAELKTAADRLDSTQDAILRDKLTTIIGELEKLSPTMTTDLFELE